MKFCSSCGATVSFRIPPDDNRERFVCDSCQTVHYQNPRMVVGTIPVWGDQILLCRRAIEPRYGYWTLPAGFMENGETVAEGSRRETTEEAGATIELQGLYTMIDVPFIEQVHIFFRARLLNLDFDPGPESLEVKLFRADEIPWQDLAFRTVAKTLKLYLQDRETGDFPVHNLALPAPSLASAPR